MKPRVYDNKGHLIGILENAVEITYSKKFNDLWTAGFKLPVPDPKNALCQMMNLVEIYDGERSMGLYRIVEAPSTSLTEFGSYVEYSLEHVITFLMGDFIYTQSMSGNTTVKNAILHLLGKQTPITVDGTSLVRWQLGECDYTETKFYQFEETNLLKALFDVPLQITDSVWHYEYDTSALPWTMDMKGLTNAINCEIRYGKNLVDIERQIDASKLVNRLYVFGPNGETISSVNSGQLYIDDAESIAQYGVFAGEYKSETTGSAQALKDDGLQALAAYSQPVISYSVKAIDTYLETGRERDRFDEGKVARIVATNQDIDIVARIIEVTKNDVDGDPLAVDLTIANIGNRFWRLYDR